MQLKGRPLAAASAYVFYIFPNYFASDINLARNLRFKTLLIALIGRSKREGWN
jgi:hypothetical protein